MISAYSSALCHFTEPIILLNTPFDMICIQKFSIGQVKVSDLEFESSFSVTMQQDKECHVSLCSMQLSWDLTAQNIHTISGNDWVL